MDSKQLSSDPYFDEANLPPELGDIQPIDEAMFDDSNHTGRINDTTSTNQNSRPFSRMKRKSSAPSAFNMPMSSPHYSTFLNGNDQHDFEEPIPIIELPNSQEVPPPALSIPTLEPALPSQNGLSALDEPSFNLSTPDPINLDSSPPRTAPTPMRHAFTPLLSSAVSAAFAKPIGMARALNASFESPSSIPSSTPVMVEIPQSRRESINLDRTPPPFAETPPRRPISKSSTSSQSLLSSAKEIPPVSRADQPMRRVEPVKPSVYSSRKMPAASTRSIQELRRSHSRAVSLKVPKISSATSKRKAKLLANVKAMAGEAKPKPRPTDRRPTDRRSPGKLSKPSSSRSVQGLPRKLPPTSRTKEGPIPRPVKRERLPSVNRKLPPSQLLAKESNRGTTVGTKHQSAKQNSKQQIPKQRKPTPPKRKLLSTLMETVTTQPPPKAKLKPKPKPKSDYPFTPTGSAAAPLPTPPRQSNPVPESCEYDPTRPSSNFEEVAFPTASYPAVQMSNNTVHSHYNEGYSLDATNGSSLPPKPEIAPSGVQSFPSFMASSSKGSGLAGSASGIGLNLDNLRELHSKLQSSSGPSLNTDAQAYSSMAVPQPVGYQPSGSQLGMQTLNPYMSTHSYAQPHMTASAPSGGSGLNLTAGLRRELEVNKMMHNKSNPAVAPSISGPLTGWSVPAPYLGQNPYSGAGNHVYPPGSTPFAPHSKLSSTPPLSMPSPVVSGPSMPPSSMPLPSASEPSRSTSPSISIPLSTPSAPASVPPTIAGIRTTVPVVLAAAPSSMREPSAAAQVEITSQALPSASESKPISLASTTSTKGIGVPAAAPLSTSTTTVPNSQSSSGSLRPSPRTSPRNSPGASTPDSLSPTSFVAPLSSIEIPSLSPVLKRKRDNTNLDLGEDGSNSDSDFDLDAPEGGKELGRQLSKSAKRRRQSRPVNESDKTKSAASQRRTPVKEPHPGICSNIDLTKESKDGSLGQGGASSKDGKRQVSRRKQKNAGVASSDEFSGDESSQPIRASQESVGSQPLELKISGIIVKRRKKKPTQVLPEVLFNRLEPKEHELAREAFYEHYPRPPSNLEAAARFESAHGRPISQKQQEQLWEVKLKPWSNKWWNFYSEFVKLVRQCKNAKPRDRQPTMTRQEVDRMAAKFHKEKGPAREEDEGAECKGCEADEKIRERKRELARERRAQARAEKSAVSSDRDSKEEAASKTTKSPRRRTTVKSSRGQKAAKARKASRKNDSDSDFTP